MTSQPASPVSRPVPPGLRRTFAALQYPNYRLWYYGQMTSLFGTWMQSTAQGYLVFQITQSSTYLGYVAFASGLATWLFMMFAGVVADRVPRRTLLIITQSMMMVLAFILAGLTFTGVVQAWMIVVLAFFLGVANAFDAPSRLAFVSELVDRVDLTNAIALNATMFNVATATGPALAGLTYAAFGPGWCFLINGISFIAVIGALVAIRIPHVLNVEKRASPLVEFVAGIRYVGSQKLILTIICLIGATSLFSLSFVNLIPAWAIRVLGGDATTNGLLQSARGLGALISAIWLASLGRFQFKGQLLTIGTFAFPVMLLIFSLMRWTPTALFTLLFVGMAQILIMNLANALVQTLAEDHLRGRVMGIYSFVFFGMMPIGGLLMGTMADHIGEPLTVATGAGGALLVALLVLLFVPKLRRLP
jgi:MFS family permease